MTDKSIDTEAQTIVNDVQSRLAPWLEAYDYGRDAFGTVIVGVRLKKGATAKTLDVTSSKDFDKDAIKTFGDPDTWQLICKASNEAEGWMKSTKAMHIDNVGALVQVTTQQKNPDGSYAIAEAITFVPNVKVYEGQIKPLRP